MVNCMLTDPIVFTGKISKFTGDRKVICIPKCLSDTIGQEFKDKYVKIRIEVIE